MSRVGILAVGSIFAFAGALWPGKYSLWAYAIGIVLYLAAQRLRLTTEATLADLQIVRLASLFLVSVMIWYVIVLLYPMKN